MRKLLIFILLGASQWLSGCAGYTEKLPFVHRIDIQQGNVVTQEMVDQLKPGMHKRRVRHIMGTPLLIDTFHEDTWYYLYSFHPGGGERQQRRLVLLFEGEDLQRIDGDVSTASIDPNVNYSRGKQNVEVPLKDPEGDGLLKSLMKSVPFVNKDKEPRQPATAAVPEPQSKIEVPGPDPAEAQPPAEAEAEAAVSEPDVETKDSEGFFGRLWKKFPFVGGDEEGAEQPAR